jgi:hypothetical protein
MEKYSEEQVRNFFQKGNEGNQKEMPKIISKLEAVADKWRQLQKYDPEKKWTAKRHWVLVEAAALLSLEEAPDFLRVEVEIGKSYTDISWDIRQCLPSLYVCSDEFFILPSGCIFRIDVQWGDVYIYQDIKEAYPKICQIIQEDETYYTPEEEN